MCATRPTHRILLNMITLIIFREMYKSRSSTLCNFLQPSIAYALLGPNILFSTLFLYIVSLYSSVRMREQLSQPYKTTGKIILLFFSFL
jgi:uncharacterized membrane protein